MPEAVPEAPLPREAPVPPETPASPVIPVPLGGSAPPGIPAPPKIPIPPGAPARSASLLSLPPLLSLPLPPSLPLTPLPLYSPYEREGETLRWEGYLGRTPRSSSTATRMKPATMITQIHLAREWNPSSLISVRGA